MAMLAKTTASPLLPEDGKAPAPKGAPEKKGEAKEVAATVIDADGIFGRTPDYCKARRNTYLHRNLRLCDTRSF